MGERFGDDVAPSPSLHAIVADGGGGIESLLEVARLEQAPGLSLVPPDAGQTVGLQLEVDRESVGVDRRRSATLALDLGRDPEEVLDMMAHLVGDDVGLGEIPGGAEATLELGEEREVEVDPAIRRTVEGTDRGGVEAARRCHGVGEQDERRLLVATSETRQGCAPGVLRVGEDDRDEIGPFVARCPGLDRCGRLGRQLERRRLRDGEVLPEPAE